MEIIAGVQEYDVKGNWKLMVENSVDDYHLPTTHWTWLNFMKNSGVVMEPPKGAGMVLPTKGLTLPLMSFGGSALIATCCAIAVLLRVDWENRQLMRGLNV